MSEAGKTGLDGYWAFFLSLKIQTPAEIAFRQMFEDVMSKERKNELDLYGLIVKDDAFRMVMLDTLKRVLGQCNPIRFIGSLTA